MTPDPNIVTAEVVEVPKQFHEAKTLLDFDPQTGFFRWLKTVSKVKAGREAGNVRRCGYLVIKVNYLPIRAHRLAFWWVHGWLPKYIDHVNRNKTDNRISNLRPATVSENTSNTVRSCYKVRGVRRDGVERFRASIKVKGRTIHLGTFGSESEAAIAYNAAAKRHFGNFAVLNDESCLAKIRGGR